DDRTESALERQVVELARRAREASRPVSRLGRSAKDAWLLRAAARLEAARAKGLAAPMVKRLDLDGGRWNDMLAGLRQIAALDDPVGEVSRVLVRPNGLRVGRMRIPLGVIGIIYESRPNVTVDAGALCVKAGNAVVLRGGSEAIHSNLALVAELRAAARDTDLPEDAIGIVPQTDRAAIDVLLRQDRYLDLVIPRGGPALIQKVTRESRIPVVKHDAGVCHVFLDPSADPEMAVAIALDSKLRQMSVCNGLETLLAHRGAARTALPPVLKALHEQGVEIRGCPETCTLFSGAVPAAEADWGTEYLDRILAVRIVPDLAAAVEHIQRYGTDHTEGIVTRDHASAERFLREVQSAVVGVNCSTAFSDGYRLGLGAEIGISTSRLHAYGPMGLESLTTQKFVLYGEGQLRE